jgi:fatty-acyl-CoA synthase
LALVVLEPGRPATAEELIEHLAGAFKRWQLPDRILFVASLPKTSVGKLNKKAIRAEYVGLYAQAGAGKT